MPIPPRHYQTVRSNRDGLSHLDMSKIGITGISHTIKTVKIIRGVISVGISHYPVEADRPGPEIP
jgi:hypothetical protein